LRISNHPAVKKVLLWLARVEPTFVDVRAHAHHDVDADGHECEATDRGRDEENSAAGAALPPEHADRERQPERYIPGPAQPEPVDACRQRGFERGDEIE